MFVYLHFVVIQTHGTVEYDCVRLGKTRKELVNPETTACLLYSSPININKACNASSHPFLFTQEPMVITQLLGVRHQTFLHSSPVKIPLCELKKSQD